MKSGTGIWKKIMFFISSHMKNLQVHPLCISDMDDPSCIALWPHWCHTVDLRSVSCAVTQDSNGHSTNLEKKQQITAH